MKTAILNDRLYVQADLVTPDHLEAFTHRYMVRTTEPVGNGRACGNCKFWMKPWKDEQGKQQYCHNLGYTEYDSCSDFDARTEVREVEHVLESYKRVGSVYAFARGDLGKVGRVFHDFTLLDERSAPPLGYDLKFISQLRPDQVPIVERWLQYGYGIIKSPTGSGKSVLLSYLIAHLGLRTLILSHETRHLTTLYNRLDEHTNFRALEAETGRTIVGRFLEGSGDYPITFSTFQAFNSEQGKEALARMGDSFGLVWVDECHHTSAPSYHSVFSSFNSKYRGGTTATPTRKDQTHHATYNSIGPITAEGGNEMLSCVVSWVQTGVSIPHSLFRFTKYGWTKMLNWLGENRELKEQVLDNVIKDIVAGYKPLVICERLSMVNYLKNLITQMGYNVEVVVGQSDKKKKSKGLEDAGGTNFEEVSAKLLDGRLHCVIGTNVLNENIDIRPLDCLHLPFPSANAEMEEQRAGRIRRPLHPRDIAAGHVKNTPVIRVYCFTGHNVSAAAEKTRKVVYTKLGFAEEAPAAVVRTVKRRSLAVVDEG